MSKKAEPGDKVEFTGGIMLVVALYFILIDTIMMGVQNVHIDHSGWRQIAYPIAVIIGFAGLIILAIGMNMLNGKKTNSGAET